MEVIIQRPGAIDHELTKYQILQLATKNASHLAESGKYDLLATYIELKRYETYLKQLLTSLVKPVRQLAEQQHSLQPNEDYSFAYSHAEVRLTARVSWDFSSDQSWRELEEKLLAIVNEQKAREKFLKENDQLVKRTKKVTKGLAISLG